MDKNILIIGAGRSGKTTLAKKLNKEKGYNLISIDNIVSGLEAYPELNISHDGDAVITAKNLGPFLIKYFTELSEGSAFYDGVKTVIEGTHIDFESLMPFLQSEEYSRKYEIIGLTYNNITEEELYNYIKKYDTIDDWTYWCSEEELKNSVKNFILKNKCFDEKFKQYNIKSFDTSFDRDKVLNDIVSNLESVKSL